ncbi:efflux transporter periplasmic adaptor subunit [Herbaspirillum sp. meg3]|jgi:RND family efflux transporter MFP subunit|uniref:efflux RND transporter periplasmic adaptor subunit n=1 Tax=Herbaspirillum sp. meg3 TaxID=2025949 RepID=UPI000B99B224|nr:efflux RND transporter periplasmic adaptor subunit [Herbaspirillum sp. meg3]ASU36997.1 efflux transporter periplasmic adaptor subunit [Herbaspirillum sp. meg3]
MSQERHSQLGIHPVDPDASGELLKRQQVVRRTKIVMVVVLVLLAVGAARTVISRVYNARELEAGTAERAKQYVKTAIAKSSDAGQTLSLPGTLQGFVQSPISARAAGYLKRWHKDIGSRVEKGELLAELDTPEIDQQLSQAIAARQQAASSLELAKSTVDRWEALRKKDAVSQQELDERRSGYSQARSNLAAADANVERLRQVEGFKRIVAPFAGVITRRNVDVGDLIDPGAGGGAGRALFTLAQTDPLRVYINVPQSYANLIKQGQKVVVTQSELRGKSFEGKVVRTAASIDVSTRTMQVEVSLPNADGVLLPGAFVQVALPLKPSGVLVVSTDTLIFRRDGSLVAVVDDKNRVHLKRVQLGRNYGQTVEILDGITGTERLILNPSDSVAEGDEVALAPETKPAANPAKADGKPAEQGKS